MNSLTYRMLAALATLLLSPMVCADTLIRIGATMSESGAYATQGRAAANGYRLCEQDLNKAGGLLDRPVEIIILDDRSDSDRAIALYEQLIEHEGVDAVLGPYGSTLTEAVAPVTERHRMVQVSPLAATSSIWQQGREYLFMVLPPAELFLAGLIDMADGHGLKRVAVLAEDALFPRAAASGAAELAEARGMSVSINEIFDADTTDYAPLVQRLADEDIEVLAMAASNLDHFIGMVRQMKASGVDVAMFGTSGAVSEFQEALGKDAEYIFGLSAWEPGLPNPGSEEFVAAYELRFERAPSFHAAGAYGSCRLFVEAIEQAGSLDQDAIRNVLLKLETQTVFGPFAVDERGYQVANQGLFIQWQDGRKVVVWPEELAQAEVRYPVPGWIER